MNNQTLSVNDKTISWLSNLKNINPSENVFLLQSSDSSIMNPSRATATAEYIKNSNGLTVKSDAPETMFDGIQTIANICRVKSNYNPLDPEKNGDKAHFLAFTQLIASVPCLTLLNAKSKEIKQKSHNANDLIDSFVNAFDGLSEIDLDGIKNSVSNLAKAALSYASQIESESNFTQNILQTGDDSVVFSLYSSVFYISATERKGKIKFKSEYTLNEAQYSLSSSTWEQVKSAFSNEAKTSLEEWLNNMKTEDKSGSTVEALCLK